MMVLYYVNGIPAHLLMEPIDRDFFSDGEEGSAAKVFVGMEVFDTAWHGACGPGTVLPEMGW